MKGIVELLKIRKILLIGLNLNSGNSLWSWSSIFLCQGPPPL